MPIRSPTHPILVVLFMILVLVILVEPYKSSGRVDVIIMSLLALWNALLTCLIVRSLKAPILHGFSCIHWDITFALYSIVATLEIPEDK